MNYDTYKKNMLSQGRQPVSREEFEMNKESLLYQVEELKDRASEMQNPNGENKITVTSVIGKFLTAFAKAAENLLK